MYAIRSYYACGKMLTDTAPITCDTETFKLHLSDNDIPVLVDFYSPDCAPCMEMAPDYDKAADSFALEVRFLKVNTLENADIALQYSVNQLPTIIAVITSYSIHYTKLYDS